MILFFFIFWGGGGFVDVEAVLDNTAVCRICRFNSVRLHVKYFSLEKRYKHLNHVRVQ